MSEEHPHALDLDRVTPTKPPADRARSGQQKWRNLLFTHWQLPVDAVRAVVPPELELDPWDGQMFVGCVPFEMEDIAPSWLPGIFALDFLETNLRTYVHYKGEPGVYFFSLEAASRLAVQAARWGWSLPYHYAEMSIERRPGGLVSYSTVRTADPSAKLEIQYRIGDAMGPSAPGSLEFFLLERYYLFSLRRGRVLKGHVHHVPYPAHRATVESCTCGLLGAAGLPQPDRLPDLVHYSPGVDVDVFGPWPVSG